MSQNPIATFSQYAGGNSRVLNVTAAAVIKGAPGQIRKIFVLTAGGGGSLTINDLASTSGDAAANRVHVIPNSVLTAGAVITIDCRCSTGIAITGVPTGSPVFTVTYD